MTLLAIALPLVAACLLIAPRAGGRVVAVAPALAVPPLLLAAFPGESLVLEGLLLGTKLDPTTPAARVTLLVTGALWLVAAPAAARETKAPPFWAGWLVALSGMAGVAMARDAVGFYAAYALLTYGLYPLVAHAGTPAAVRAGRLYLVTALVAEMALLAALLLIATVAGNPDLAHVPATVAASPRRDLLLALLIAGFGVKAALVPLHVWVLPAYASAPAPAGVVLAGGALHAGVLGWVLTLPLGAAALPGWGAGIALLGGYAVAHALAIGIGRTEPGAVLGASSITQVGFMAVALGAGLADPRLASEARDVLIAYVLHHALAKGALFLGIAVLAASSGRARRWVLALLLLPALDLAGAPLTSGSAAKAALGHLVDEAPWGLPVHDLLSLGTIASALLVIRFLSLSWGEEGATRAPPAALWVPWVGLVGLDLVAGAWPLAGDGPSLAPAKLASAAWPIAVAVGVAALFAWRGWSLPRVRGVIALAPRWDDVRATWDGFVDRERAVRLLVVSRFTGLRAPLASAATVLDRGEARLGAYEAVGVAFGIVFLALLVLLGR